MTPIRPHTFSAYPRPSTPAAAPPTAPVPPAKAAVWRPFRCSPLYGATANLDRLYRWIDYHQRMSRQKTLRKSLDMRGRVVYAPKVGAGGGGNVYGGTLDGLYQVAIKENRLSDDGREAPPPEAAAAAASKFGGEFLVWSRREERKRYYEGLRKRDITSYENACIEAHVMYKLREIRHSVPIFDSIAVGPFVHASIMPMLGADLACVLRSIASHRSHAHLPTGLGLREVVSLTKSCLEYLLALKNAQYVHGDIKPGNLCFDRATGKLTVIDYGHAKNMKPGFARMHPSGTYPYKAPELILRAPYDYSIDMWSLGGTLFCAYTGYWLFAEPRDPRPDSLSPNQRECNILHCIISLLGPIPPELLSKLDRAKDGVWNYTPSATAVTLPKDSIEKTLLSIGIQKGDSEESVKQFIDFLKRIFVYKRRLTPEEAMRHPFVSSTAGAAAAGTAVAPVATTTVAAAAAAVATTTG